VGTFNFYKHWGAEVACSAGVFWDWGEEIFAEGVGISGENGQGGRGRERKNTFSPNPSPYPASAPTLYRSSIQLQSKMAASNRFI